MEDFKNQLLKEREHLLQKLMLNADYQRLKFIEDYLGTFNDSVERVIVPNTDDKDTSDDFPLDGTYLEQIAYIIKKEDRFLHNSEITDFLIPYWKVDKDKARRRVSAELSKAKREQLGTFTNYQMGNSKKNVYWGSKNWLGNDGKPLSKHMYKIVKSTKRRDLL